MSPLPPASTSSSRTIPPGANTSSRRWPGGVAVFDYDGDGLTDIFFTNGAETPSLVKSSPKFRNRLYRNLGGMKFEDVTGKAGLAGMGYSTAAAAADYDNDGDIDLFVGGVRQNFFYRNRGDGTFEDAARKPGSRAAVGVKERRGSTTTTTEAWICSSSTISNGSPSSTSTAETPSARCAPIAIRGFSTGGRILSTAIAATAALKTCPGKPGLRPTSEKG